MPNMASLEQELEAAIMDELTAVSEYAEIARKLNNRTLRALVLSIIGDEYGHARTWMTMQELLFGNAMP